MSRNNKNRNRNVPKKSNVFDFLTTVIVAALNKGQLPLMFLGLYVLIFCFRIPSNEIVPFFNDLIYNPQIGNIVGWLGFVGVSSISFYINRRQRRKHTDEMKRISGEKKRLQEELTRRNLPSSNN